jgi:adenylate cyclase
MSAANDPAVTRRLAAILIADVVGYTRLMERDDTGTFSRLRTIRDEVADPAIVSHGGRIVKTAGDGLLAEFPSALSALRTAVQVQREMAARNADVPAGSRIEYRIGINLGDVMVDGSDIAGDGINVASRLEALCEPGGICVSGSVREQVHGTVDVGFEDIGEQQVKNITRPIRAFAVRFGGADGATSSAMAHCWHCRTGGNRNRRRACSERAEGTVRVTGAHGIFDGHSSTFRAVGRAGRRADC